MNKKVEEIVKGNASKTLLAATSIFLVAGTVPAFASGIAYQDGDRYIKLGGRLQLQYHMVNPDDPADPNAETTDTLFFRRLRPYIEGSVHKDWVGKIQWDLGKAEDTNELSVKDAFLQYKGVESMKVTVGNAVFPFSREVLTSSKKQQLVERTFVGDHDYGTPEYNLGVHLTGHAGADKMLTWGASLASACIDPDHGKLDFDTPVNENSDFNQGWIIGGRADFHPMGNLKFEQGAFKGETKMTVSVAAFSWANDDDNNPYTDPVTGLSTSTSKADVDSVVGFEVSAGYRVAGLSLDAEYNSFSVDTVDPTYTGGIYQNGSTDLKNYAAEAGYMVVPKTIEIVAGYEVQDADGYAETWNRTSFGANWFMSGNHDIKLQATYRMGENLKGVEDNNEDELFVQMQYVF